jgi:hypothetical protein
MNMNLPNEFIYVYSAILYPENEEDVVQFAIKVSCDSFFTFVNLLYKNYIVAIASVIVSAKFLNLPTPLDQDFRYLPNMRRFCNPAISEEEFNKKLLNFENKSFHLRNDLVENGETQNAQNESESYFNSLETQKKIHPFLNIEDLRDCVCLILEYYEDVADM